MLTPHSGALCDVDPKREPPDGSFIHKATGRSYRVYRRDGQLHHEEVLRSQDGTEIARVDQPVRYRIGSGHFGRNYLIEIDGFLKESPISWYEAKHKWDMSPGYDTARHEGFERTITIGCLACHAGRVEPVEDTNRLIVHEKGIGCESCHGPGSRHVELHRAKGHVAGTEDLTIVNPAKLPRPLLESVCGACHMNGPARILLRGRKHTDYRSGMPLTDYRIDYRLDSGNEQMTVVGHLEQLRQSACYQKSKELTCLTCHNPHASEKPKDRVAFYRQQCLHCHTEETCKLERAERLKKEARDYCVACHMPQADTDVAHVAFTHHRIGRHAKQLPAELNRGVPRLVPTDDVSGLSLLEQKLNLGLAYHDASDNVPLYRAVFRELSRGLLEEVRAAGLRQGQMALALAENYFRQRELQRASACAREAVEANDSSVETRSGALRLLGLCEMQENDFELASARFKELTRIQNSERDWRLLGLCYLKLDQPRQALESLSKALAIRPYQPATHIYLAQVYEKLADFSRAAEHLDKARWLQETQPGMR